MHNFSAATTDVRDSLANKLYHLFANMVLGLRNFEPVLPEYTPFTLHNGLCVSPALPYLLRGAAKMVTPTRDFLPPYPTRQIHQWCVRGNKVFLK